MLEYYSKWKFRPERFLGHPVASEREWRWWCLLSPGAGGLGEQDDLGGACAADDGTDGGRDQGKLWFTFISKQYKFAMIYRSRTTEPQ